MSIVIKLFKEGNFAKVKPEGFLGEDYFGKYLKAIEGARYIREKRANLATFDKVPNILIRLREAGFSVQMDGDLIKTLQERTAKDWNDDQAVKERIDQIDKEIFERSKRRLFNYQKPGARWLSRRYGGLLADEPGLGKALANFEPVLTPDGWKPISEIKVGDKVIGSDGHPVNVIGVYPQGEKEIFKVELTDGSSVHATFDHLWCVQSNNDRKRGNAKRVLSTGGILAWGLRSNNNNGCKWFIPIADPVQFNTKNYQIDPYVIGALIANGSLSYGRTPHHCGTEEQRTELLKFLSDDYELRQADSVSSRIVSTETKGKLWKLLDHCMLTNSPNKAIPNEYLFGDIEQRTRLLQGLMDNDGTISKDGMCLEYNTTSIKLSHQVLFLIRSLGSNAWLSTREPKYTYKGEVKIGKTDYRIRMNLNNDIIPFRIPSKKGRLKPRIKYPPAHGIDSITLAGKAETTCIKVDADDELFITKDFILTHNTIQALVALPANVPCIVICPASIKGNWVGEIEKCRPHLKPKVLEGRDSFYWPKPGEMLITNYDILPDIHDRVGKLTGRACNGFLKPEPCLGCKDEIKFTPSGVTTVKSGHMPDCNGFKEPNKCYGCHPFLDECHPQTVLIWDEAQKVKNGKSKRSLRARALSKAAIKKEGRSWVLTGTPLENDPKELWYIMDLAGIAEECFGNWNTFVSLFKGKILQQGNYTWGIPDDEVVERIRRGSLRRMKNEVLEDLPEKLWQEVIIDVDKKYLKQADDFLKEFGGIERLSKLLETDKIPFEKMSSIRSALATAKIPALCEIIQEFEELPDPIVVFSMHRAPIDMVGKLPGWETLTGDVKTDKRQDIIDRFQAGKLKGLACTIQTAGVGFTLTRANRAIFVDLSFKPTENQQAEDRLHRIGADKSKGIIYTILKANHVLDKRVTEILIKKRELIVASVDAASVSEGLSDKIAKEFEEEFHRIQKEIACGRAIRRMAESEEEKRVIEEAHTLKFSRRDDERLVLDLLQQASLLGLSEAQWQLLVRVSLRGKPLGSRESNEIKIVDQSREDVLKVSSSSNVEPEAMTDKVSLSKPNSALLLVRQMNSETRSAYFESISFIEELIDDLHNPRKYLDGMKMLLDMTDEEQDEYLEKLGLEFCPRCGDKWPDNKSDHDCPVGDEKEDEDEDDSD